jgi:HlyD family secretion protein
MTAMKKKKGKRWMVIAALALVIVFAVLLFNRNNQATAAFTQEIAATGSITSYYSFSGHIKVENSQSITATAPVTIREIYVREGNYVNKTDRVLRTSDGVTIKAGVSGEVERLHVAKDDEVQPGDPLIDIVDFDHMAIEIRVDEFDVTAVNVGESALVTVNALGETFETTVTRLDRRAMREGDISYYKAELALGEIAGLLPGMQVDVKICNAHAENVTFISMNALQFFQDNTPFVTMMRGNSHVEIPVRVGVNDGVNIEIAEGVRSGETVMVPAHNADTGSLRRAELNSVREDMAGR